MSLYTGATAAARAPMPHSPRMIDLMRATERDLESGVAPLGHQFLCDNDVTLDEAYDLADAIKSALQVYRTAPAQEVLMAIMECAEVTA